MELLRYLTDIFEQRGYQVLISSPENSYMLLSREQSTLAVGYSDPGNGITEGEAEMFVSMARSGSADSMLFISPQKLDRSARRVLEKEGSAIWDRMALAIALGENMLSGLSREEKDVERGSPERIMDLFRNEDVDPLKELREYSATEEEDFKIRKTTTVTAKETEAKDRKTAEKMDIEKLEFPDQEKQEKDGEAVSAVSEDILMGAWAGFEDWKKKQETAPQKKTTEEEERAEEEAMPSFDMPMMSVPEETPPEKVPWIGSTLAPEKCGMEEACSKAGVPPDTDLEREHLPHILVSTSYTLKSEDGDSVRRKGNYLYDPIKGDVLDIPEALADELENTLSVWDGERPASRINEAREDDRGYERVLKEKLRREKHAEDRLMRETLMSTIYQEVRYLFDPSSFDIERSSRVIVPYWIKRDENGNVEWMVDSYLGRFIRVK